MTLFVDIRHLAAFPIGALCVYVSLAFRNQDDRRFQNWLVDLWVRIEGTAGKNREVAFFNEVAAFIIRALNETFGPKLMSLQFAAVSASFSVASLYLLCTLRLGIPVNARLDFASTSLMALFLGLWTIRKPTIGRVTTVAGLLILLLYGANQAGPQLHSEQYAFAGTASGILLDWLFVAACRKMLRVVEVGQKLSHISAALAVNFSLGLLLIGPAILFVWPQEWCPLLGGVCALHPLRTAMLWTLTVSSATNLYGALCVLSVFIVSVAALLHKLMWRFTANIVHVIYERRVIEKRLLLFTIGSTLLSYSTNWFSWLRHIPY